MLWSGLISKINNFVINAFSTQTLNIDKTIDKLH